MAVIILIKLVVFYFAVVLHEISHGFIAYKLGDPTAKNSGRLTLNPIAHIDPVGTVLLPLVLFLTGANIIFGWAKPVPVNYAYLQNPKQAMPWIGFSGPAANLFIAFICSVCIRFVDPFSSLIVYFLQLSILINVFLSVFNLIPIPPLDGSRIIMGILPPKYAASYASLEPVGIFIVMALWFSRTLDRIVLPVVHSIIRILLPS